MFWRKKEVKIIDHLTQTFSIKKLESLILFKF